MLRLWINVRHFFNVPAFSSSSEESDIEREEEEKAHLTVLLQQGQFTRSWPISIQGWLMWADVYFAPSSPQHSYVCLHFHEGHVVWPLCVCVPGSLAGWHGLGWAGQRRCVGGMLTQVDC